MRNAGKMHVDISAVFLAQALSTAHYRKNWFYLLENSPARKPSPGGAGVGCKGLSLLQWLEAGLKRYSCHFAVTLFLPSATAGLPSLLPHPVYVGHGGKN